jgi:hypothetical protein
LADQPIKNATRLVDFISLHASGDLEKHLEDQRNTVRMQPLAEGFTLHGKVSETTVHAGPSHGPVLIALRCTQCMAGPNM